MKRYRIETREETEETKVLNVTLDGDLFAVATFYKGERTSQIRIDPNATKDDFKIDHDFIEMHEALNFIEMHEALKEILFQMHNEEDC